MPKAYITARSAISYQRYIIVPSGTDIIERTLFMVLSISPVPSGTDIIEKSAPSRNAFFLVREMGLEPIRDYHTPLKRARLPIPPLSRFYVVLSRENSRNYITPKCTCQHFFSTFLIFFDFF